MSNRFRTTINLLWFSALLSVVSILGLGQAEVQAARITESTQPGTLRPALRVAEVLTYTTYLPYLARNDASNTYGNWAVQFYDFLGASSGFEDALAAGVRWMRLRVSWFDLEPANTTPANYNWASLDSSIQAAQRANVTLIVTIEGNPSWAATSQQGPVTNLNNFRELVGALASRYPYVTYWEIYNEPDNNIHFGGKGATYAAHLNAAYTAIKAANPQAKVVMGGIAMDWFDDEGGGFDRDFLTDMLTACTQPCFDIANFHYYPVFRANWEAHGRDIIGKAKAFAQMLAARGYQRPIMSTETGWGSTSVWGGQTVQARYFPKTMIRSMEADLITANWFAMIDADSNLPGLLGGSYPNFQQRPAYGAARVMHEQLHAANYQRALSSAELGNNPNLEGYVFTNYAGAHGTERVDVVWYDCPSMIVGTGTLPTDCLTAAPYAVSANKVSVVNHVTGIGQIYRDDGDGVVDGRITLNINTNPVYIHYQP